MCIRLQYLLIIFSARCLLLRRRLSGIFFSHFFSGCVYVCVYRSCTHFPLCLLRSRFKRHVLECALSKGHVISHSNTLIHSWPHHTLSMCALTKKKTFTQSRHTSNQEEKKSVRCQIKLQMEWNGT